MIKRKIWVTFSMNGIHCYPDAPEEVKYLRDLHRHKFNFKVTIEVFHDDREIEFHLFQNWIISLYNSGVISFDYKSCEMLASELIDAICIKYPNREIEVEVSEDGECGASLAYEPEIEV